MASQGPNYPTVGEAVTSGDANEVTWTTPGNIVDVDADEATITAATFDSPDPSFYLVGRGYGFTIPAGATIDGITVEINRRSIIANSGMDTEVRLHDAVGALIGDNKGTGTVWPSTLTIATYGGATDTWNTGLSAAALLAMVNDADFGVALQAHANIVNADIGVSYIRVTIDYTPAADTALVGSSAGSSTAAGAATTQITFAGGSTGTATAVGALTTQIALAGAAAGTSASAGVLTDGPGDTALAGASAGASDAAGALSTAITLAGVSAGAASAGAGLTTAIPLAATSAGASGATGGLSTQIPLASTAAGTSSAGAALTTDIALAGAVSGASEAAAILSTAIALVGSSAGAATAAGALADGGTPAALVGTSAGTGSAAGDLLTAIRLAGESGGVSSAAADLATAIALAGVVDGVSTADGVLNAPAQNDPGSVGVSAGLLAGVTVQATVAHSVHVSVTLRDRTGADHD